MGEVLRKAHKASLTTDIARKTYDSRCREWRAAHGGKLSDHAEITIYNIASLEDTKAALQADIQKRGAVETIHSGRQAFSRPNKSVVEFTRVMERQERLSARLSREGGKITSAGGEGDTETLDDFDG
ncbi:MAG: hypothetical protein PHY64_00895 [Eubacteriales bacterium]|nr:hypothetical protein [Eubacteriales bacterium]